MDIRNATQMANFLSQTNLVNKDAAFEQLAQCINNFASACACSSREEKMQLYAVCNKLYFRSARDIAPRLKNDFLSQTTDRQITFYTEEGNLIAIISR
jgi:hypothetical protein